MNLLLDSRINHYCWPSAMRTSESRCSAEQTADQGALCINLTPLLAKMRTTQSGKRRVMFFVTFDWKPEHFFTRSGHRPTAIVTSGYAVKGWNTRSKKQDFLADRRHWLFLSGEVQDIHSVVSIKLGKGNPYRRCSASARSLNLPLRKKVRLSWNPKTIQLSSWSEDNVSTVSPK